MWHCWEIIITQSAFILYSSGAELALFYLYLTKRDVVIIAIVTSIII